MALLCEYEHNLKRQPDRVEPNKQNESGTENSVDSVHSLCWLSEHLINVRGQ